MIPIKDRIYLGTIATLLLIILFLRMCNGTPAPCPKTGDIVKSDTLWLEHSDSTGWIRPVPTAVIPAKVQHDTLEVSGGTRIVYHNIDTGAILRDYYLTRYYNDSLTTQYGTIWVMDSVNQNRIFRRKWETKFSVPVVTKTVELTAPAKWQVYAGFSLSGNKQSLLYGFGPELLLKTKRDQVYGIGAQLVQGGDIYYNGKVFFKINFHKH